MNSSAQVMSGNAYSDSEDEWASDASGEFEAAGFEADAAASKMSANGAGAASAGAAAPAIESATVAVVEPAGALAPLTADGVKALIAMATPSLQFAGNNGTGRVIVELSWTGTLASLKAGTKPHLKSLNPKLATLLGGAKASIASLFVHGFDNSDSPVSLGVSGDHMNGTKFNSTVCDTGEFMFNMPKRTARAFDAPIEVFRCPQSPFKKKMAAMYGADVDETTIGQDVRSAPWLGPDVRIVPAGSPVLSGVAQVIKQANEAADAANEEFAGIDLDSMYQGGFQAFKLPAALVTLGMNVLTKMFIESKDKVDVQKDFYLSFARTSVSTNALASIATRAGAAAVWEDAREVPLRSGQKLENAMIKPFDVKVTVSVPRYELDAE